MLKKQNVKRTGEITPFFLQSAYSLAKPEFIWYLSGGIFERRDFFQCKVLQLYRFILLIEMSSVSFTNRIQTLTR